MENEETENKVVISLSYHLSPSSTTCTLAVKPGWIKPDYQDSDCDASDCDASDCDDSDAPGCL